MLIDELIHSAVVNQEDNMELLHHGVKGMKWGVRKYKQERKNAVKAMNSQTKQLRKHHSGVIELSKKSNKVAAKKQSLDKAIQKGSKRKIEAKTKRLEGSKKKYTKAANKFDKNVDKYNKNSKIFNDSLDRASKLPVTIKETPKRARAKKIARDVMSRNGQALTGRRTITVDRNKYTKSDQFDMEVKKRNNK